MSFLIKSIISRGGYNPKRKHLYNLTPLIPRKVLFHNLDPKMATPAAAESAASPAAPSAAAAAPAVSDEQDKRLARYGKVYNNLVEKCFDTCVQSFRRKTLEKDEERVRAFLDRPRTQISFPNLR